MSKDREVVRVRERMLAVGGFGRGEVPMVRVVELAMSDAPEGAEVTTEDIHDWIEEKE